MLSSQQQMYDIIKSLFENDLKLVEKGVPSNGIWTVARLLDTDYQGAVRVIPSEGTVGEYTLWVDVFETIYDPVYSNALKKGNLKKIKDWLSDAGHIEEVYNCMHHLHSLAEEDL